MQETRVTAGGRTYPLDAALPGLRHAEPHRAGGHLPAARGAARPLHVPGRRRLPERATRRCRSCAPPPARRQPALQPVLHRPSEILRAAGAGAARAGRRSRDPLRRGARAPRRGRKSPTARRTSSNEYLVLGRRAARVAVPRSSAAKARAILDGRYAAEIDDVRARGPTRSCATG